MQTSESNTVVELGSATTLTLGAGGPNLENVPGGQSYPHGAYMNPIE